SSVLQMSAGLMDNAGRVFWTDTGNGRSDASTVVTSRPRMMAEAQNNTTIAYAGGNPVRFDNAGTYRKAAVSGVGTNTLAFPFNNYGAVDVQSGTLDCTANFNNYGVVSLAAGTTNRVESTGTTTGMFTNP